jgi:hypothetical protein
MLLGNCGGNKQDPIGTTVTKTVTTTAQPPTVTVTAQPPSRDHYGGVIDVSCHDHRGSAATGLLRSAGNVEV